MASFKALNTGSPKATSPVNGAVGIKPEDTAPSGQPVDPNLPTYEVEQREVDQRESWLPPRQSYPPRYPDVEVTGSKRKRSGSPEPSRRELPQPQQQQPSTSTPLIQTHASNASHGESREPYPATNMHDYGSQPPQPSRTGSFQSIEERSGAWYPQQSRGERPSPPQKSQPPEDRPDESVRRPTAGSPVDDDNYSPVSPEDDGGPNTDNKDNPGTPVQDEKKRKRVFSNRTKTGCFTCRKRKKKCDEQKPECHNCIKGGFVCTGYPAQKSTWLKQEQKVPVVTIESKDPTYVPPGPYGMPQTNQFGQTVQTTPQPQSATQSAPQQPLPTAQPQSQQHPPPPSQPQSQQHPPPQSQAPKRNPLPAPYRNQPTLRIDPPTQFIQTDDDRPTASTLASASILSPDNNKLSAISSAYTNSPGGVFPTPVSAVPKSFNERLGKDFQRVPPLHDLSRTSETDHLTPVSAHPNNAPPPQLPQIQILHPTRTSSPMATHRSTTSPSSNPQVTARMALNHPSFPSNRHVPTQKEEMIRGRQYYPSDNELVLERERCSASCWRFNDSMNPNNGISPPERARLFREILQPREPIQMSPTGMMPNPPIGRVGNDGVVEAPFACTYGYNIQIGDRVRIDRNCHIMDTCSVQIANNCVIGPNVSIYTGTLPTDPSKRRGSQGPNLSKPVVLDADCFIGGGAIIMPGVTIGKGATVGAGSVVTKNVAPFTIAAGNPAKVQRGAQDDMVLS